jgi:hypothetical protein
MARRKREQAVLVETDAEVAVVEAPPVQEPERAAAFVGDETPEPVLINIVGLDTEGLARVATREFGVQLDADISHEDALEQVRHLIVGRNRFGMR